MHNCVAGHATDIPAMLLDAKAELYGFLSDVRIKSRGIATMDVRAYLIHPDSSIS